MEVDVQAKVKTTKIVQGPAVDKDNVQLEMVTTLMTRIWSWKNLK
jgi:hypothetical protein